ncbi:type II toxin-antitoxin system HicB family antitoxin [Kribbella sp. NPDC056951]|uniref:type II toxin-antitoxin system HicB family antitoxin n=1 Tax=Kribbella sp. NPDC056951 TaxID=3345978 RepID=UPI003631064D
MEREITIPFLVEQDENGAWAAQAALTPNAFANGQGDTREEAIEDLKSAIALLAEEVGIPEQLVVTVNVP